MWCLGPGEHSVVSNDPHHAAAAGYGAYSGFPANVSNIKAVSSTQLTMTMDKAYSPTWFLYNDLSQVTPMPTAWDRTASGPSSCTTTLSDCAKVYAYLNAQALLDWLDQPLIATSANLSGQPTCRTGIQVFGTMDGRVDLVLDGGACNGAGATTVDITEPYWKLIKEGAIEEKEIAEVLAT